MSVSSNRTLGLSVMLAFVLLLVSPGFASAQNHNRTNRSAHRKNSHQSSGKSISRRLRNGVNAEGVHLKGPGHVEFADDGTILAGRTGMIATGPGRKTWISRKIVLNGKSVFAYMPK
jgi:hypothetical protein